MEHLAQHVEQRPAAVGHLDLLTVDLQLQRGLLTGVDHGAEDRFAAMPLRPLAPVSRRRFLVGGTAAAGAVLLGACGDDGSDDTDPPTTSTIGGLSLVQFFGGPMLAAGGQIRAPFGVADADGLLPVDRTPGELTVAILGKDGEPVVDPVDVARHAEGLPRGYFPLLFTVEEPGIYTARTELEGEAAEMAIQVDLAEDVPTIQVGRRHAHDRDADGRRRARDRPDLHERPDLPAARRHRGARRSTRADRWPSWWPRRRSARSPSADRCSTSSWRWSTTIPT